MGLIKVNLVELEGLAMNGFLTRVEIRECSEPSGWKEIIAYTREGRMLSSGCIEGDAARRNYAVLSLYIRSWSKHITRSK